MQDDYCKEHPTELIVAVDGHKMMCNRCIFNSDIAQVGDQLSTLNFTSFIAGNLKDLFDSKFDVYR